VARIAAGGAVKKRPRREEQELTLIIAGPPASGRTTVASIVAAALREAGAEVTVADDGEVAERFGPLIGRKIRIQVRLSAKPGATALRLVR
jgi:adenylylsulfate kinase-like enzyme